MNFDRVAPFYQFLETIAFGETLQRARIHWIDKIDRPNRALIVGEGNGRFLRALLRIHPKIDIDCVDASAPMLELTRARLQRNCPEALAQIHFHHADIRAWSSPKTYDLIVTHFFLDCFNDHALAPIIARLADRTSAHSLWLISDFALPSRSAARVHAKIWLAAMYAFFRFTTGLNVNQLVDPRPHLQSHGFLRRSTRLFRSGLLHASVYSRASLPDIA